MRGECSPSLLIFLHGLNSNGASATAEVLRRTLGCGEFESPTYPAHRPDDAVATLHGFIAGALTRHPGKHRLILLGSSMGAFYARYLSRRFPTRHLVMINPVLRPWELIEARLGQEERTRGGTYYLLTPELAAATRRYAVPDPCDGPPTTLLIDKGDELIDYHLALEEYRRCGRIFLFPGGSHAFEHMDAALPILREICESA